MEARAAEQATVTTPQAHQSQEALREQILEAMLIACGERGYRAVAISDVLEIYGGHRVQFWQQFANKEECFAAACKAWMKRLEVRLLGVAVAEASWRESLRAALIELFRFVNERPAIARALFVDSSIAGGAALDARVATMERLARALDSAGSGEVDPTEAPPALTAKFVVGGIESCVVGALADGEPERVWEELPELVHFAVAPYCGERAAEEDFAAARELAARATGGAAAARQ